MIFNFIESSYNGDLCKTPAAPCERRREWTYEQKHGVTDRRYNETRVCRGPHE